MNKLLILIVGLIVLGGVGYIVMTQMKGATPITQTNQQTGTNQKMIEISNSKHSPSTLTVKPGETVWVTNKDLVGHTVTSDNGTSFDTGIISQNQTVSFTAPTVPGTYTYHCTPHPSMKATLIVQ